MWSLVNAANWSGNFPSLSKFLLILFEINSLHVPVLLLHSLCSQISHVCSALQQSGSSGIPQTQHRLFLWTLREDTVCFSVGMYARVGFVNNSKNIQLMCYKPSNGQHSRNEGLINLFFQLSTNKKIK